MTGLDTNILVRYFVADQDPQRPLAVRLVESLSVETPGYVPVAALLELTWVLRSCYKLRREGLARVLFRLLGAPQLRLERPSEMAEAIQRFTQGPADLPDYLIERRCAAEGCVTTVTFDVDAARSAGMTLLREVREGVPS